MSDPKRIDISPWIWNGFHRRGFFSLHARAKAACHIPMPASGDVAAWVETAYYQALACLSLPKLVQLFAVSIKQVREVREMPDEQRMELAPAGCLSPVGTLVAMTALHALAEKRRGPVGHFLFVTLPFLWATFREVAVWLLGKVFILLPGVCIVISSHSGREHGLPSLALFIASLPACVWASCQCDKLWADMM